MRCDYHSIDGSGLQELEADRDLAYNQFTSLVYGYAFKETKPPEGYQIPAEGTESEKYFWFLSRLAEASGRRAGTADFQKNNK